MAVGAGSAVRTGDAGVGRAARAGGRPAASGARGDPCPAPPLRGRAPAPRRPQFSQPAQGTAAFASTRPAGARQGPRGDLPSRGYIKRLPGRSAGKGLAGAGAAGRGCLPGFPAPHPAVGHWAGRARAGLPGPASCCLPAPRGGGGQRGGVGAAQLYYFLSSVFSYFLPGRGRGPALQEEEGEEGTSGGTACRPAGCSARTYYCERHSLLRRP
nr:collagen alpha-2(I) chain-like [Cavia porcellus]